MQLHHVQVLSPPGEVASARAFYSDLLELQEMPKPSTLTSDGCVVSTE